MMEFEKLTWRIKREMQHNRKPILLLFGNGYDSQLLLMALHKLRKKFMVIHAANGRLTKKTKTILKKLGCSHLILRPYNNGDPYKKFYTNEAFCVEDLNFGFSHKDYFIITGFKITEPSLVKAFQRGFFNDLYAPLLRYSDDWIETLYQDMKDTEPLGEFLYENIQSDSHHNITIN